MHLLPHRSLLRFLPPVAVFLFSAVVGISFAAWIDAPNAPPNYNIDPNCTPPCLQADFKPMNLGTTPQTKSAGAIFEGNLTANSFIDHDDPAYYIDPASNGYAGLFNGRVDINGNVGIGTTSGLAKLSINGGLHVGGDSDPGDNNALIDGDVTASGFYDTEDPLYYVDPASASGYSGLFQEKVGIRQPYPSASLAVNNPYTSDKRGSTGDAIYAYANNTSAAISAEQANAAGYAIYASGGINYFGGEVRVGSAADPKNLCLNDACETSLTGAWTRNGSDIYNNNSGNVGIGTGATAPLGRLEVSDSSTSGTYLVLNNKSLGGTAWSMLSTGSANSGGAGDFGIYNGGWRLYIAGPNDGTNYGNVGIGTTNPLSKLSVGGDGYSGMGIFSSAPSGFGLRYGVYGLASGTGINYGVYGDASGSIPESTGVLGVGSRGVSGYSTNVNGYSGYFSGGKGIKVIGGAEITGWIADPNVSGYLSLGYLQSPVEALTSCGSGSPGEDGRVARCWNTVYETSTGLNRVVYDGMCVCTSYNTGYAFDQSASVQRVDATYDPDWGWQPTTWKYRWLPMPITGL